MTRETSLFDRVMRPVKPTLLRDFLPEPRLLADGIWRVERRLRLPPGLVMPTNMTLVRLRSGGLVLVSLMVIDETTRAQVERLGRVEALVAPNTFHYVHLGASSEEFPDAQVFLAPGLRERIEGLPEAAVLSDDAPPAWEGDLQTLVFGPVQGFSEVVLLHAPSRTLILTDLAFHLVHIEGTVNSVEHVGKLGDRRVRHSFTIATSSSASSPWMGDTLPPPRGRGSSDCVSRCRRRIRFTVARPMPSNVAVSSYVRPSARARRTASRSFNGVITSSRDHVCGIASTGLGVSTMSALRGAGRVKQSSPGGFLPRQTVFLPDALPISNDAASFSIIDATF